VWPGAGRRVFAELEGAQEGFTGDDVMAGGAGQFEFDIFGGSKDQVLDPGRLMSKLLLQQAGQNAGFVLGEAAGIFQRGASAVGKLDHPVNDVTLDAARWLLISIR
jgi:hypothetical protein